MLNSAVIQWALNNFLLLAIFSDFLLPLYNPLSVNLDFLMFFPLVLMTHQCCSFRFV